MLVGAQDKSPGLQGTSYVLRPSKPLRIYRTESNTGERGAPKEVAQWNTYLFSRLK